MNLEGIEQDPQTKKVHCQVCKEEDPLQLGTWMLKKSLTKHLDSNVHKTCVLQKVQHEEQATAEQMHLEQVYHAAPVSPIDSFLDMDLRPPSGMFDMPDTNHCAPCHWNEPPIPISMNPIYEDEFRVSDSSDDITVTNISEQFDSLGMTFTLPLNDFTNRLQQRLIW